MSVTIPVSQLGMSASAGFEVLGTGWLRDLPDIRDFTPASNEIMGLLAKVNMVKVSASTLPGKMDLRQWCSPVENQGNIGSCTANAGVALLEYFEKKATGKWIDASRLFLYKATRNLMRVTGDTGAYLRMTMAALRLFGTPPESFWPYQVANFDKEPPAFCYAFGGNYKSIKYFRLDPPGVPMDQVLSAIKINLAAGLPSMFGFTVYNSIAQAATNGGKIPVPVPTESSIGGHAVDAVGYDDSMKIKNNVSGVETNGALLIRNSWGDKWGDKGYGWLPYDYVQKGLAVDWWTIITSDWVDTNQFGFIFNEYPAACCGWDGQETDLRKIAY